MQTIVPIDPDEYDGPYETASIDQFEVLSGRDHIVLVEFHEPVEGVEWFDM